MPLVVLLSFCISPVRHALFLEGVILFRSFRPVRHELYRTYANIIAAEKQEKQEKQAGVFLGAWEKERKGEKEEDFVLSAMVGEGGDFTLA